MEPLSRSANIALLTLAPQPNFPAEDLDEANADMLAYLFADDPGIVAQSLKLAEYQYPLHAMATVALRNNDWKIPTNQTSYEGFTLGFSALDALIMYMRGRAIDIEFSAQQFESVLPLQPYTQEQTVARQLLQHEGLDESNQNLAVHDQLARDEDARRQSNVARMYKYWPEQYPNTYTFIGSVAAAHRGRRPIEYTAGAVLGAQSAVVLQNPLVA